MDTTFEPIEIYMLERTLEKKIFSRFRVEASIEIQVTPLSGREVMFQADIVYVSPVARYISDEINAYVGNYLDMSPHRN